MKIVDYRATFNLTDALLARGYSEEEFGKILGATGFGSWTPFGETRMRNLSTTMKTFLMQFRTSTSIEGL